MSTLPSSVAAHLAAWRYRRLLARLAGPKLLAAFAEAYPRAFFVEIGANDGEKHDHLRPFIVSQRWAGIMVEPVPYVFLRLQERYRDHPQIRLENAAITDRDGTMPFFHLREAAGDEQSQLPEWYDALGSFSRDVVLSHATAIEDLESRLVEIVVPTLTFTSLLAKHAVESVDLVLVDTEGYDAEIINSIDVSAHRPSLLVYEHYHLRSGERSACLRRLEDAGYLAMEEGFDTFCVHRGAHPSLVRAWRQMKPGTPGVSKYDEASA